MDLLPHPVGSLLRNCAPLIPISFAVTAAAGLNAHSLRRGAHCAAAALVVALVVAVGALAGSGGDSSDWLRSCGVRVDALASAMLLLVTLVGFVIARYSVNYLGREPRRRRYARWYLATLGSVTLLVQADHLLLLCAAWTFTSLSLHQLLTFYPDRTPARLAANKKFVVSRLGDVCLWAAVALLAHDSKSFGLHDLQTWVEAQATLPLGTQGACVLLCLAAGLKSAQLPFHGWLTQVMEAPTTVSALLHAGVINLGGFLLVRTSFVLQHSPAALALLLAWGGATAAYASLVTSARVSAKVALAWSTCAQMGFMLFECGLGAWNLALLHLVGHSLYKAHAFLRAASIVSEWREGTLAARPLVSPAHRGYALAAVMVATAAVSGCLYSFGPAPVAAAAPLVLLGGVALAPLWAECRSAFILVTGLRGAALIAAYMVFHGLFAWLVPTLPSRAAGPATFAFAGVLFFLTTGVQNWLRAWPSGRLAAKLHPYLFAGASLDDWLTRLALRLDGQVPPAAVRPPMRSSAREVEA